MISRRRSVVALLMGVLALLAPVFRAGEACARPLAAAAAQPGHGPADRATHEHAPQEQAPVDADASDHCATAAACVAVALATERAVDAPTPSERDAVRPDDDRAPFRARTAPEPPPPRA